MKGSFTIGFSGTEIFPVHMPATACGVRWLTIPVGDPCHCQEITLREELGSQNTEFTSLWHNLR